MLDAACDISTNALDAALRTCAILVLEKCDRLLLAWFDGNPRLNCLPA